MTDDELATLALIMRKQLRASPPERYRLTREIVYDMYADACLWLAAIKPDFDLNIFYDQVFEGYPSELYG